MGFVFYDTETTGTDKFFDQILQFAAIKTDENLNELDRFEIRCCLLPHIVMAPGAMLVTGVTIEQATNPNLPTHYSMVRAIRKKLLEWSPAIFVGYNSMAFDEELLRQAQYQTLHNPYLTQRQGNGRADAMMLTKAIAQFAPECLNIPIKANGRPVFKLDQVAPANGFDHRNAHDAMADVEAVIHLCRMAADGASSEWSNFIRFSQKAATEAFLMEGEPLLVTEFFGFGGQKHYPVIRIGADAEQSAKHLCYDLSHDPNEFRSLSDAALLDCFANKPKPLRKVKSNAAPTLRALEDAPAWCLGNLTKSEVINRAEGVLADTAFVDRLIAIYEESKTVYADSEHVEQQIYSGFPTPPDEALMETFHATPWAERHQLIPQFTDNRLSLLATRLIYFEDPSHLPQALRQDVRSHIQSRVNFEGECKWGTVAKAIAECDEKLPSATSEQVEMLQRYKAHLQTAYV
ncbi:exonuclease domain-containing protein [Novosphingobium sp.]|uniref:exonuclease domain-containing protein n=1 Tax=Novosphingobium sp. TaxID=1874826 RepID=UPI0038BA3DF3